MRFLVNYARTAILSLKYLNATFSFISVQMGRFVKQKHWGGKAPSIAQINSFLATNKVLVLPGSSILEKVLVVFLIGFILCRQ